MALHKLAYVGEVGLRDEALAALDKAEAEENTHMPAGLAGEMLSLVRRRLESPDYLRDADYGAALLELLRALPPRASYRLRSFPSAVGS